MAGVNNPTSPKYRDLNGGYPTPTEPVNGISNDYQNRDLQKAILGVYLGLVVDSWPATNSCLVQVGFDAKIKCSYPSSSFAPVTGVTTIISPPIGSVVIVAKSTENDCGFILGPATLQAVCNTNAMPKVAGAGYNSTFNEIASPETFECGSIALKSGQVITPLSVPGEISSFSESNVGFIHGKYFYKLQAGPLASLMLNIIDDWTDWVAHNLQISNSGFRLRSLSDCGIANTEILTAKDAGKFGVMTVLSGHLASGLTTRASGGEIWQDETGNISVKSATGAWLQKVNGIYVPIKKYEADDPSNLGDQDVGDRPTRIGFNIAPKAHPAEFGCKARDYTAWQTVGMYRHARYEPYKKDWVLPPAGGGDAPGLGGGQYARFGDMYKVENDTSSSSAQAGEAFVGTLPDGSVMMRDAWGSSVELRGGKIIITCAKDLDLTSGKSTVIMAGNDLIMKSRAETNLTSFGGRIRLRSAGDMLLDTKAGSIQLTAEDAPNGPLTEPKGNKYISHGIVFKCNKQITSLAPRVNVIAKDLVSIMGPEDDESPFIFIKSSTSINWAESSHMFYVGKISEETPPDRENFTVFTGGSIQTGAFFLAEQSIYGKGSIFTDKNLFADGGVGVNGYVASFSNGPYVGSFIDPIELPPESEKDRVPQFEEAMNSVINEEIIKMARGAFKTEDYDRIRFTYRESEEYKTRDYVWFEALWQRLYSLGKWDHSKEKDRDSEYVYPGKDTINSGSSYIMYSEVNVTPDGTPITPQQQKQDGGNFTKSSYNNMEF